MTKRVDTEAVRARLAAATPGPWHAGSETHPKDHYWEPSIVYAADGRLPNVVYPDPESDLRPADAVSKWDDDHCRGHICETHNYFPIPEEQHDGNNRLIAHAPTDLAALADAVDDAARLLDHAMTLLREVWKAGNAEGRLGELWNLAGEIDVWFDPGCTPVVVPAPLCGGAK